MSAAPASLVVLSPALRSFDAQWKSRATDRLHALRDDAMQRALRLGLPTTRDESWRYTNLRRVIASSFVDAPRELPPGLSPSASPLAASGATITMVNGHPVLPSELNASFKNIEINSLRNLSQRDPDLVAQHLGVPSDSEQARWALLNTALFQDGLHLRITGTVPSPLLILHVLNAESANTVAYPCVIIELAPGAVATVIEQYVDAGTAAPLCNSATHIGLARDSRMDHYRVFSTGAAATHVDTVSVRQGGNSTCRQFTVALGGALVRHSLDVLLREPGASLDSHSLLVGHESRHVDCVNVVTHDARDTRSRQTARALAGGGSRVVFNSKVVVNAGAVHADSNQSCRGLLLSPTAEIDTRPQLEIHTDEVKCAHGATVGRLDPDMLFYLLSRGLDRDTAQSLLIYAFLADVLTDMTVPGARNAIESALIAQLPNSQTLNKFR